MKKNLSSTRSHYVELSNDRGKFENPFELSFRWTIWDVLKVSINLFWLFPLRLLLIAIPIGLIGMIFLLVLGLANGNGRPLVGWRKTLLVRAGCILNRCFLFGMGFNWINIVGQPASSKDAPVVVAAPHSSVFDMFLVSLSYVPSFIARIENRSAPVIGRIEEHTFKSIFVSRTDKGSRQQCKEEILRRLNSSDDWPPIVFFPEGTTTNRKAIIHFKHGAFSLGTAVQPVLIRLDNRLNTMLWGDSMYELVKGILLTFCQFHNSVTVEYLPVYYPSEEERENSIVYAHNVRKLMAESIAIPITEHSYEDVILMRESKKLGMPYGAGEVEFAKTCSPYSISLGQLKKLIKRFASMDTDKDGFVTVEDFARFLKMSDSDAHVNSVFNLLDKNGAKQITFADYSRLLTHTKSFVENEQFLTRMFQFFDQDNDGLISRSDLLKLPMQLNLQQNPSNYYHDDHIVRKCSLLTRCRNSASRMRPEHDEEQGDRSLSAGVNPLYDDPSGPWNYDEFKLLMNNNLEYLLLFNEYHNSGFPPNLHEI